MIKTLKNQNRRVISVLLVFCMLLTLVSGSLAYFTDRVDTVVSAKAGSVSIELDYTGINLKDADGKDILNPGDGRNFNYTVTSTGSKSIDVKETIILSAYDKNLQPLALSDTQSEFEIYKTEDVTYDATKGWLPNEGASPITVKVLDNNVITYNRPVYVLSGNSELDDDKREIEYNDNGDEIPSIQSNELMLIFKAGSLNTYQAAVLKADLLVEAKQHRNTEAVEWIEVQSSTLTISNGNTIEVVPGATEFGPQESEDGNWIYKDNGDGTVTIVDTNKVIESGETLVIPEKVDGKDVTGIEMGNILNNDNIDEDVTLEFENPEVAKDVEADLIFTYTTDAEGVHIVGLTPTGAKLSAVSVPETIKGQPVLDVDYEGILNSSNGTIGEGKVLKSIITNEDVIATKGVDYVFNYTDNGDGTASITGFTTIGRMLATHINVPEEINGLTVTKMGVARGVFGDAQMTELTIPSTVTSVSVLGFNNNKNLKTVNYNTTAYSGPTNGAGMFSGSPIETLNLGSGVTKIYDGMLYGTIAEKITINSVEDITEIGQYAFANLKNTTSITFNDEVMLADGHLTIPDTVTTIGRSAFGQVPVLTEVTIPENVSSIGVYAFTDNSIKTVNYNSTATPSSWNNGAAGVFGNNAVEEVNFGAGITAIPRAFLGNTTATEITVNSVDTLTIINSFAFYNKNVTSINITNANITAINDYAFQNCSSLSDIKINGINVAIDGKFAIPTGVTSIGRQAFDGCTSLKEIIVPDTVTTIGLAAFQYSGITEIVIPNTVTSLGNTTLLNCTSLKTATINTATIPNDTFSGCTALESVTLSDNLTTIGSNAFKNCTSISEITIPASVTKINANAFAGWTADQTIYVEGKTAVSEFATSTGLTDNANLTIVFK